MPPLQQPSNPSVSPRSSATPLISSDQRQAALQRDDTEKSDGAAEDRDPKTGKRRFFGLGKKKEKEAAPQQEQQQQKDNMAAPMSTASRARGSSPAKAPVDLRPQAQPIPISPSRLPYPSNMAASPSRFRSSSPRLHSPASSEIFERSVQEPVQISTLQGENTPAHLPTHVMTEDHIPPALEASAQAITSEELNPDEVEIVTSASHQPAAASVLEGSQSHADLTSLQSPMSPLTLHESEPTSAVQQPPSVLPPGIEEELASNYGQLDPNDVRRLSFISFADVVQSEHQQPPTSALGEAGSRDSLHIASLPGSFSHERAASPLRQPRSPASTHSHSLSGGVTTPPTSLSVNPAAARHEQSPNRSAGIGSPVSHHGELTIETMRQAVRKTASGDLSGGGRTAGMSPVSDENLPSAPRSRTNT